MSFTPDIDDIDQPYLQYVFLKDPGNALGNIFEEQQDITVC